MKYKKKRAQEDDELLEEAKASMQYNVAGKKHNLEFIDILYDSLSSLESQH